MGLIVNEFLTRVQSQFGDSTGNQVALNDVVMWINDAMREINSANSILQVKASSNTLVNVNNYNLPNDIFRLHSVKFRGLALRGISMQDADSLIGNVDLTSAQGYPSGTPTHYWIWANQIFLYPAPDASSTSDLVVYYVRAPVAVAIGADSPELPDEYDNRILEYCMAQAYERDESYDISLAKMGQFQEGVSKLKGNTEWTPDEFYPMITALEDGQDSEYLGSYYG